MRRGVLWFVLAAGILLAPPSAPHSTERGEDESLPSVPPLPFLLLYDTIRTDLGDYTWPLPASRIVTSTFGEYRRTHFHAGIDISTGDATGYKVVASRAGDVSRIRVEPSGYGKIIYIRHADGYTTTYAHLRSFAGAIERRTAAEQARLERYPVDIICAPGEIRVAKGELIAYSGETGTGSEHLHFEIRDENMNGVNPFLAPGLRNPDRLPPRFLMLALLPVGTRSRVNGSTEPRTLTPRQTGPRAYRIGAPIRISGAAGFGIFVRDHSEGSRFSNGVYRHTLFVDGRIWFEIRLDRVPVETAQQIAFSTAREFPGAGRGKFEKLFVDGLHTLPFYSDPREGAGQVSEERLSPGSHEVRIVSQDFSGNSAELTATVILERPLPVVPPRPTTGGHARPAEITDESELTPHGIRAALRTDGAFTSLPTVAIEEGGQRRTFIMHLIDARRAEALIVPAGSVQGFRPLLFEGEANGAPFRVAGGLSCYPIIPGQSVRIAPPGTGLVLEGDSLAVFDTTYLQITRIASEEGTRFDLSPAGGILRNGFAVTLPRLDGGEKQGIFTRTVSNWSLASRNRMEPAGAASARMGRWIGDIWLARDTLPPVIHSFRLSRYVRGATLARFRVYDDLAGVDYHSLATYIDGKFVCPDIDGEHRRASVPAPAGLTRGAHSLTIRLSDQLGNTSILERRFVVP